jgi:membrane protein required for colicin V production
MNFFDWIIIAIIGFFSVKSIFRGATREIFSLLALLLASLVSCRYYSFLVLFLQPYINPGWAQNTVAFIVLFLTVYILVNITGWLLSKLLKKIRLSALDRIAGAFVGSAKAYIIICCIIIILILLPNGNKVLKNSALSSYSLPLVTLLSKFFPEPLKGIIEEKTNALRK